MWVGNLNAMGDRKVNELDKHGICDLRVKHDGLANHVGHPSLGSLWNILANLVKGAVVFSNVIFLQPCNGIHILHPLKGSPKAYNYNKIHVFPSENCLIYFGGLNSGLSSRRVSFHGLFHTLSTTSQTKSSSLFRSSLKSIKGHSASKWVYSAMCRRVRDCLKSHWLICRCDNNFSYLLSPVRLGKAKDISQSRHHRLQVELRRLSEISLFAKVVQLEQGGTTFDLGLDQGRRRHFKVSSGEEMIPEALDDDRPHLQHLEQEGRIQRHSDTILMDVRTLEAFSPRIRIWRLSN